MLGISALARRFGLKPSTTSRGLKSRKIRPEPPFPGECVAIPAPKTKRTYKATPALELKLREATGARDLDCPPEFFTELR